jgi:hypothetical protein
VIDEDGADDTGRHGLSDGLRPLDEEQLPVATLAGLEQRTSPDNETRVRSQDVGAHV